MQVAGRFEQGSVEERPAIYRRAQLAVVVLVALALRLIRLGTFPYWHDEVHNLIASEDLYALVFHGNLISNHPPLPYILVAFWRALGMDASEWTMRLLPVAFGVSTVVAVYALGRRFFGERAGLFAAFLLAVAPLHIYHSQDLKEYIYLPFVATVMVLVFYRAMETGKMRDWIAYGALAGLACYTEIFVGPLLVAINLWALAYLRSRQGLWRGWLVGNVLGAVLFLPWLGIMLQKADATIVKAENWWVPAPSIEGVGYYFKSFAFGYTAQGLWFKIAFAVYAALVAAGTISAYRQNRRAGTLVICWAVVPVAIVYAISLCTQSIFLIRALLPYAVALYVLAGVGLAALSPRALRAAGFCAVCFLAGTGLVHQYQRDFTAMDFPHRPGIHPPRDYSGAADLILSRWQDGDVVVHCSAATWLPFYWYGFRGMPQYFAGVGGDFIADIKMGNPRNSDDPFLENYWPQEPQSVTNGAKRVWLVFGEWERKYLAGNATDVYRWIDAHFSEVEQHSVLGLEVMLFLPHDVARPLARDLDDGVAAEVTYSKPSTPFHKVEPDNALVARSEAERRGALLVRWAGEGTSKLPMGDFAQTESTWTVSFAIENRSSQTVSANTFLVPSDHLVDVASLYEADPVDEVWHVYGQHNPSPPPQNFNVGVASAHLLTPVAGELFGQQELSAGPYRAYVFALGTPGDTARQRAAVTVRAGDLTVYRSPAVHEPGPWAWNWLPGESFTIPSPNAEIRVTASRSGDGPNYADLVAVAFIRDRSASISPDSFPLNWPGTISLKAGESLAYQAEVDADIGRTDLWVYESGESGKAYRIFRIAEDAVRK